MGAVGGVVLLLQAPAPTLPPPGFVFDMPAELLDEVLLTPALTLTLALAL